MSPIIGGGGGGGGSQTAREKFNGLLAASPATGPNQLISMPWTKAGFAGGDNLLDLTDPLNPTIITAGVYIATMYAAIPNAQVIAGTWIRLDLELDSANDDADQLNTAALKPNVQTPVAATSCYYCPAGAVLNATVQHDEPTVAGNGPDVALIGQLQRLS